MSLGNEVQGAAYIAHQSKDNPQEILLRIIEENGDENRDALFEKWRREIQKRESLQRAVDMYFFLNMFNYYFRRGNKRGPKPITQQEREQLAEHVRRRVAKIGLMYLLLPNQKMLKDATFGECAQAGGIFMAIAEKGGPHQIVGEVLNERDLEKILHAHT
jgi:hypothetical protein